MTKTRHKGLEYSRIEPGLWRFIVEGRDVGPQYATEKELLADVDRYAAEYGLAPEPEKAKRDRLTLEAFPDVVKALRETLRALEQHLDDDTNHAGLKHRDQLCPCNGNEVPRARDALKRAEEIEARSKQKGGADVD